MATETTETVQSIEGVDEGKRLTNKDLNTIWLRWAFTHLASMSYEKLQGHAYAWSYIPFANKYYKDDPEAKRRLLVRHSVFFNTEPQTGQIINGIVTSLEENIALGGEVSERCRTTSRRPLWDLSQASATPSSKASSSRRSSPSA